MTGPRIVVDTGSGVAPWRQVRDQLSLLISAGTLPVGTRLPTIRQLARDLGLAPGTVARAYRELETLGVLSTGRRQGTVVAALPITRPDALAVARSLGADVEQAVAAVRSAYVDNGV
jgi:GntR family transcriptional regulator